MADKWSRGDLSAKKMFRLNQREAFQVYETANAEVPRPEMAVQDPGRSTGGRECRELGLEWKQSPGKSSLVAKLRSLSKEPRSSALIWVWWKGDNQL